MKSKRLRRAIPAGLMSVLAVVLAACGQGSASPSPAPSTAKSSEQAPSASPSVSLSAEAVRFEAEYLPIIRRALVALGDFETAREAPDSDAKVVARACHAAATQAELGKGLQGLSPSFDSVWEQFVEDVSQGGRLCVKGIRERSQKAFDQGAALIPDAYIKQLELDRVAPSDAMGIQDYLDQPPSLTVAWREWKEAHLPVLQEVASQIQGAAADVEIVTSGGWRDSEVADRWDEISWQLQLTGETPDGGEVSDLLHSVADLAMILSLKAALPTPGGWNAAPMLDGIAEGLSTAVEAIPQG